MANSAYLPPVDVLSNTGVTAGSYTNPNLTVDAKGRITVITNGTGGGAGNVTDLTDTTVSSPGALAAGNNSNVTSAGTYTAPTPAATVTQPPQRFAITNMHTASVTLSFPNPVGTTVNLTVLPGEVVTFRQKTTSGYANESGNKPLAQLDLRYVQPSQLATVATSGSYNDLSNKPTIPTNTQYVDLTTAQTVAGDKTFTGSGAWTGTGFNENVATKGVFIGGISGDTSRMLLSTGTASQNWQIDNSNGTFRWFTPGTTRMSLTSAGELIIPNKARFGGTNVPTAFVQVNGSTTGNASLRIDNGTAPSAPNNGDIWYDGTNLVFRLNSTSTNLTNQIGTTGSYVANSYITRQNFNSTAYLDGATAGVGIFTGRLAINSDNGVSSDHLVVRIADATFKIQNVGEVNPGFITQTFQSTQMGALNSSGAAVDGVPATTKQNIFGWKGTKVGSLSNTGISAPVFRNVIDDGAGNMSVTGNFISASTGNYQNYNTIDQVTNYERIREYWVGNVFNIGAEAAGTGVNREINILSSGGVRTSAGNVNTIYNDVSNVKVTTTWGTTSGGTVIHNYTGTWSSSSINQTGISITPVVNQSGTASYTGLRVNVSETATGSGTKQLVDLQVGGLSKFTVDNAGAPIIPTGATAGYVLTTDANGRGTWQIAPGAGGGMANPMTTAGDIIYGGTSGSPARLPAGTATQVLVSGTTPSWLSSTGTGNNVLATSPTLVTPILNATTITTDTTTGLTIGTATTQKLGFFNTAPVVQQAAATDLGTVLSALGLRASGTAFPITTTGSVSVGNFTNTASYRASYNTTARTGAVTLTINDSEYQEANASTAAFTITPPATTTAGYRFVVTKIDSSANAVTLAGTFSGVVNPTLTVQWDRLTFITTTTSGVFRTVAATQTRIRSVTQTSHGFAIGNIVRRSTAGSWVKAIADGSANGAAGLVIVTQVPDANNFVYQMQGSYVAGMSGLTDGTLYYLSPTTAGAYTATAPSTVGQVGAPLFVADSTTSGYFGNYLTASVGGGALSGGVEPTFNLPTYTTNNSLGQQVWYGLFTANLTTSITKLETYCPAVQSGSVIELGIYSAAGSLLSSGTVTTTSTAGKYTVTLGSTVNLTAGTSYYYAVLNRTNETVTRFAGMASANDINVTSLSSSVTTLPATRGTVSSGTVAYYVQGY